MDLFSPVRPSCQCRKENLNSSVCLIDEFIYELQENKHVIIISLQSHVTGQNAMKQNIHVTLSELDRTGYVN